MWRRRGSELLWHQCLCGHGKYTRACDGGVRSFPGSSLRTRHSTIAPTSSAGPAYLQGCSYFLPWNNASLSCLSSLALNLLCSLGKPWIYRFPDSTSRVAWWNKLPVKTKGRGLVLYKNSYKTTAYKPVLAKEWGSGRIEKPVVSQLPSDKEDSLLQMQKKVKNNIVESNPIQKFIPVFGILSPVSKVGLQFIIYLRRLLNSWFFSLHLLNASITGLVS